MIQLMQVALCKHYGLSSLEGVLFEPIGAGKPVEWHYRGQVGPELSEICIDLEVREHCRMGGRYEMSAVGRLWLDQRKIYEASLSCGASDCICKT